MMPDLDPVLIRSAGHMGAGLSAFVVYGLGLFVFLVPVVIGLVKWLHYRRRTAIAEAAFDPEAPLVPGEIVLHGRVEHAREARTAVRVELEQEGSEAESSGSWTTTWTERNRRILVEPFYVKHASGVRVRVEPNEEVYLVDEMDGLIRVDLKKRIRVAELVPGEQLFAHGQLVSDLDPETAGGIYRGNLRALVLRPPARRTMLLSSEPLGARFARRAAYHLYAALTIACFMLAVQLLYTGYHLKLWAGATTQAVITGLRHYTTKDSEGDTIEHYEVSLTSTKPLLNFKDEVSSLIFSRLQRGHKVPVRYSRLLMPVAHIGPRTTASLGGIILLPLLLVTICCVYYFFGQSILPWYQKKVVDSESGRLADTFSKEDRGRAGPAPDAESGSRPDPGAGGPA